MKHIACCFDSPEKPRKAIRKAATLRAYEEAAARLFDGHALLENPHFTA